MQTPDQILESGKEEEILNAKMEGDIAQYNTVEWWKTSKNPTQVIEMHMQEIWGRNPTEGLWAMIAKEEPRFKSEGYQSMSMQRIINDYKTIKGNNISDKINNLIKKIQTMEGALIVGQRILKDEQKAEEDLRDN